MIVAQVSGYVSRPVAPTRRIARGTSTLPADGPEQFGAVLIGGMAAEFGPTLDADGRAELDRWINAITHARRDASWSESNMAGAGGAQEVEEFIGFCSGAHGAILSLGRSRGECSSGQRAAKRIRLYRLKSLRHFYAGVARIISVYIRRSLGCSRWLTGRES